MFGWILRVLAVGVLFLVIHGAQSLIGAGLPWWGSLVAALIAYVVMGLAAKALFFKAVTAPFKAKGAPLRGARLVIHELAAMAAPVRRAQPALAMAGGGSDEGSCDDASDEGRDAPPADWRWYRMDATISPPVVNCGPFRAWAPGELMVVPFDADTSPKAPSDHGVGRIERVEVFHDGGFVEDEGMSFEGEQRLRLEMACSPEVTVAKLRYYFEGFGTIELPKA